MLRNSSITFCSDEVVVPARFVSEDFFFRPLKTSDVELDYDAVISSSSMLRGWSQSDWPKDGFRLADNLEDLEWHEREHVEKIAFTYTIMAPKETLCLGCIYIRPLAEGLIELVDSHVPRKSREFFSASLRFWVRESHSSTDLHLNVLKAIDRWLERDWYFDCLAFPIAKGEFMQSPLFEELGYELIGDYYHKPRETYWTAYLKAIH